VNAAGCRTVSIPQVITITAVGRPTPLAQFYTTDSVECLSSSSFNFSNTSELNGSGWISKYKWEFGDGTTDSINTSVFGKHYTSLGKFYVKLTATTNFNCSSSFIFPVRVVKDSFCGPASGTTDVMADISHLITLYPNPNDGSFKLNLHGLTADDAHVTIVDMLGRTVYTASFHTRGIKEIEPGELSLATGKYYLVLTTDKNQVARKAFAITR
jgi:PKD repeat protein